ncbi:MAG: phytanoyl-CoA dioxygenase family protein [Bacteroidota bacterium]
MTLTEQQKSQFLDEGFLVIRAVLSQQNLDYYRGIYEDFLSGRIESGPLRSDLSAASEEGEAEKITQIMVPSRLEPQLLTQQLHQVTESIAKALLGADMALDFDMLIDKAPHTDTPTPWHQDAAYWIEMPDKRALSCWTALDDVFKENGCMWYIPGSHQEPLRQHQFANKEGGALQCQANEEEAVAAEINAGDCVIHHGGTAHYSRGNSTLRRRRAFITNYRPQTMIDFERAEGFDHTSERLVRNAGDPSS